MGETHLRVVIADSDTQDRESKAQVMEDMGLEVLIATGDGKAALDAIRRERPDIIVMDLILPGIDGIGILEEMKADKPEKEPIIIIETALRMNSLVVKALECGADYYMMKPMSARVLIQRILQILQVNSEKTAVQDVHKRISDKPEEKKAEKTVMNAKSGYNYSGDLEMDVTNILLEIGIPAHIKGYQYIREGIIMAFYDRNMLQYITKCLYPSIAKKFKTTSSSVERTIRHAIEVAWRRGNMETLEEVFGNTICAGKGKPTNSEFMALLTDKLRLEYRSRIVS